MDPAPSPRPARPAQLCLLAGLVACASAPRPGADLAAEVAPEPGEVVRRVVAVMGTRMELEVEAASRQKALEASEAALRAVEAVEARLSTWRDDSELARLNAAPVGRPVGLSPELAGDLAAARRWWRATDGAFDPGLGALVDAWGLRDGGRRPEPAQLEAARRAGGLAGLRLEGLGPEGATATREQAGLRIEEGGFGKGVGLDAALAAARAAGATAAVFDLGGQVALLARAPGRGPLRFALADPRDRSRPVLEVELRSGSLATSGNSERGIVVDGRKTSHVLDPHTGSPARDFGSLAVWAADATAADCLSTGLYVMGPAGALAFAREHDGVEVVVLEVTPAGLIAHASAGLRAGLVPLVDELELRPSRAAGKRARDIPAAVGHRRTENLENSP